MLNREIMLIVLKLYLHCCWMWPWSGLWFPGEVLYQLTDSQPKFLACSAAIAPVAAEACDKYGKIVVQSVSMSVFVNDKTVL